jgi:hypothetical protein
MRANRQPPRGGGRPHAPIRTLGQAPKSVLNTWTAGAPRFQPAAGCTNGFRTVRLEIRGFCTILWVHVATHSAPVAAPLRPSARATWPTRPYPPPMAPPPPPPPPPPSLVPVPAHARARSQPAATVSTPRLLASPTPRPPCRHRRPPRLGRWREPRLPGWWSARRRRRPLPARPRRPHRRHHRRRRRECRRLPEL